MSLIDFSAGGAQIEAAGYPLRPGTRVMVELVARERVWPLPARVLRCHVSALSPHPKYRGAVAFERPFEFNDAKGIGTAGSDVDPICEYARLNLALTRRGDFGTGHAPLSETARQALEATNRMVESVQGRQSAAPLIKELGQLLRLLTTVVENALDPAVIIPEIISRLRQSVPSESVCLVDANDPLLLRTDAVYFRVPNAQRQVPDRLVVEFPRNSPLEAWHLQLLEAGAHLIAVTRGLEILTPPMTAASAT